MRVAVTGASGYVGGWLARVLRERGHEVHGQDVRPGADAQFDLGFEGCRRHWLAATRPDVVIHLAALYGRVWGESDLMKTVAVNAGLTAELARDCAAAGIRLALASSSEVYGATAAHGLVSEDTPVRPLNCYGLSKEWSEEACRVYAPEGLVVLRLNMPYGPAAVLPPAGTVPHHSGRVGERGFNAMHAWLWQASHGMPLIVHKGTERCFTWAGDACEGVALILESGEEGIWNVCRDDDPVSMEALAWRCVYLAGSASDVVVREPDAQVTPVKRLDGARLRKLGWRPRVSLDDGMRETLAYVRMFDRQGVWRG